VLEQGLVVDPYEDQLHEQMLNMPGQTGPAFGGHRPLCALSRNACALSLGWNRLPISRRSIRDDTIEDAKQQSSRVLGKVRIPKELLKILWGICFWGWFSKRFGNRWCDIVIVHQAVRID